MTSSIFNIIVKRYLADILEIDPSKTTASWISGSLEFQNVKIKEQVFGNFNIPFLELKHGYIGTLKIKMSMPLFYRNPIYVNIDKIFIHAKQKDIVKSNTNLSYEDYEKIKNTQLKDFENEELKSNDLPSTESHDTMLQQILKNIELEIGSVVIKLEDDISNKETPFVFGCVVNSIIIKSKETGTTKGSSKSKQSWMNKIFELKYFSVFLDTIDTNETEALVWQSGSVNIDKDLEKVWGSSKDFYISFLNEAKNHADIKHSYILHNFNFDVNFRYNDSLQTIQDFPMFYWYLNVPEVSLSISLTQIKIILKVMNYIHLDILFNIGLIQNYYTKEYTKDEKEWYVKEYYSYINIIKSVNNKKILFPTALLNLEKEASYSAIAPLRKAAFIKYNYWTELSEYDKQIKEFEGKWFKNNPKEISDVQEKKKWWLQREKEISDKIKELMNIDDQNDIQGKLVLDGKQVKWYEITIGINVLSLSINDLLSIQLAELNTQFNKTNLTKLFYFTISSLTVKSNNDDIITTKAIDKAQLVNIIKIQYEFDHSFPQSDHKLEIDSTSKLVINIEYDTIFNIATPWLSALQSDISFKYIKKYAKGSVKRYMQAGYLSELIKTKENKPFNINLNVNWEFPEIILPSYSNLSFSLGKLSIVSNLPQKQKQDFSYTTCTDPKIMFDNYCLTVKGMYISTTDTYEDKLKLYNKVEHILQNLELTCTVDILKDHYNNNFDNCVINFNVSKCSIKWIDKQMLLIIKSFVHWKTKIQSLTTWDKNNNATISSSNSNTLISGGERADQMKEIQGLLNTKNPSVLPNNNILKGFNKIKQLSRLFTSFPSQQINKNKIKINVNLSFFKVKLCKTMDELEMWGYNKITKSALAKQLSTAVRCKPFIVLIIKDVQLDILISWWNKLKLELKTNYVQLYDWDVQYIQSGNVNYYISPVHSCLINCINEDQLNEPKSDNNDSENIYDSANDDDEIISKSSFFNWSYSESKTKNTSFWTINLKGINIKPNFSSITRIYQFWYFFSQNYSTWLESYSKDEVITNFNKRVRDIYSLQQSKKSEINRNCFRKVAVQFRKNNNNNIKSATGNSDNLLSSERTLKHSPRKKEKTICEPWSQEDEEKTTKKYMNKWKIIIEITNVNIKIPIEPWEDEPPMISLNMNYIHKSKVKTELENVYSKATNKWIHMNYWIKDTNCNFMISFTNWHIMNNKVAENLLTNFRLSFYMNGNLIPENKIEIINYAIVSEPVSLYLSIDNIKLLVLLSEGFREFKEKLTKNDYVIPANDNIWIGSTWNLSLRRHHETLNLTKNFSVLSRQIESKINNIITKTAKKKALNLSSFNIFQQFDVMIDTVNIIIYEKNDISQWKQVDHRTQLFKLNMNRTTFHFISNSDSADSFNMANSLVEIMSGKEVDFTEFNIYTMYRYYLLSVNYNVNYYNTFLNTFEPLIEPYNIQVRMSQISKVTRKKIEIMSNDMWNINITSKGLYWLNYWMWRYLSVGNNKPKDEKNNRKLEYNVLTIRNKSGYDLMFWFIKNKKIVIKNGEELKYTYQDITNLQSGDEEKCVVNKYKIKFSLINEDTKFYMINYGNDCSVNYEIKSGIGMNVSSLLEGLMKCVTFSSCVCWINKTEIKSFRWCKKHIIVDPTSVMKEPLIQQEGNVDVKEEHAHDKYEEEQFMITEIEINEINERIYIPITWIEDIDESKETIFIKYSKDNRNVIFLDKMWAYLWRTKNKCFDNAEVPRIIFEFDENIARKYNFQSRKITKTVKLTRQTTKTMEKPVKLYVVLDVYSFDINIDNDSIQINNSVYELVLKPPVQLENWIPEEFPLSFIQIISNDKKEFHLNFASPWDCYAIHPSNDDCNWMKIKVTYYKELYDSHYFNLLSLKVNQLCWISSTSDQLYLSINEIKVENDHNFANKWYKFSKEKSVVISRKFEFFIDLIVINRLSMPLEWITITDALPISYKLAPEKVNLISTPNLTMSVKSITGRESQKHNWKTQGLSGVFCLYDKILQENENNIYTVNSISHEEIAVIIQDSSVYRKSNLVIFEPRYIVKNLLGHDIEICPHVTHKYKTLIKDGEAHEITSIYKTYEYQLGIGKKWSDPFCIAEIDQIDVKYEVEYNEEYHHYVFSYNNIQYYSWVRVMAQTSDKGLIYITLTHPKYPLLKIINDTNYNIEITVNDNLWLPILPNKEVPFIFKRSDNKNSEMKCKICHQVIEFSFTIFDKQEFQIEFNNEKKMINASVLRIDNTITRAFMVKCDGIKEVKEISTVRKWFLKKKVPRITKVSVSLKGLGISIINKIPKEVFYISFYGFDMKYSNNVIKNRINEDSLKKNVKDTDNIIQNTEHYIVYLKNMQIDYCLNNSHFSTIFAPLNQTLPSNEEEVINDPYYQPFIQVLVCRQKTVNIQTNEVVQKFPQIDVVIKEFTLKLEQNIILAIIENFTEYYSLINISEIFSQLNIINKDSWIKWPNEKVVWPSDEDLVNVSDNIGINNWMWINYLFLSACKFKLTLQYDLSLLNLDYKTIPNMLMGWITGLGSTFTRITDSPISFSEMVYENVFADMNNIASLLALHYQSQAIRQIYKIWGNLDLLGNPIQLVNHIGTGFIEWVNEPRKGFVQGPKQFGRGWAKGVKSLMRNIIEGSWSSLVSITGTLSIVNHNLKHDAENQTNIENISTEPDGAINGICEGTIAGVNELKQGLTGIVLNPYRNAKINGINGFFSGLSTGWINAILSPFVAIFQFSNKIISGVKNSTVQFLGGKIKTKRFRYPKKISQNQAVGVYEANIAEVQEILFKLKIYEEQQILVFADVKWEEKENGFNTIILTDSLLLVINSDIEMWAKVNVDCIKSCSVYYKDNQYLLTLDCGNSKSVFRWFEQKICWKIYDTWKTILDN